MSRATSRTSLLLTILLVTGSLAAIGYWSSSPEKILPDTPGAPYPAHPDIDFYVLDSHTLKYLPDGQLHYELVAERVEHLKSSDTSLLDQPDLYVYRNALGQENPWHARSEQGEVLSGGSEVELIDRVRVERSDASGQPLILTTTRLTVRPDENYAQTSQPVRIEAKSGVTTGTGMKAYMDKNQTHLLSNVRGYHEVR